MSAFQRGLLLILLAAVFWGSTGLSSKTLHSLSALDGISVGFLRLLIAAPAMLAIAYWLKPGSLLSTLKAHWKSLLLMGLGVAGYNAFFFAGIALSSVTTTTLLALCTAPLFVAGLARVFLHEPLTRPIIAALITALTGVVLLIGGQNSADLFRLDYALGNLLALGAGLSYATYALIGRVKSQAAPPGAVIAWSFTAGMLFLAPVALVNGLKLPTNLSAWGVVVYLGLLPTAIAYVLYIFGLRHVPATVASIATLAEPLTAAILAALFLGERLEPLSYVGAALLFGSLVLLTLPQDKMKVSVP